MTDFSSPDLALTYLTSDITRLFSKEMDRRLNLAGLTLSHAQWRVIARIYLHHGLSQSHLAERVGIEKAPLGNLLDKLEQKGLIERRADAEDRRMKRIYLSNKGLELVPLLKEKHDELTEQALQQLSPAKRQQLVENLESVRQTLLDLKLGQVSEPA